MFTQAVQEAESHLTFPAPYEVQNAGGQYPAVCLVEHARNLMPGEFGRLGLSATEQQQHIAWDIGIESVTRCLSDQLGVPSLYCLYSRLIIDVNRPLGHPELILEESDGVCIPGNRALPQAQRDVRQHEIYDAYHLAANALVQARLDVGVTPLVIGMHSCTPRLKNGNPRPWHIGLSTYDSDAVMTEMASLLKAEGLDVGLHEPYDMRKYDGVSLDTHGRARGLHQVLIEIRQDLIGDATGALEWAKRLERMLRRLQDRTPS